MCNFIKKNGTKCLLAPAKAQCHIKSHQVETVVEIVEVETVVETVETVEEPEAMVEEAQYESITVAAAILVVEETVVASKPVLAESMVWSKCSKFLADADATWYGEFSLLDNSKTTKPYLHDVSSRDLTVIRVEANKKRKFFWIYNRATTRKFCEFVGRELKVEAHEMITRPQIRFFYDIDLKLDPLCEDIFLDHYGVNDLNSLGNILAQVYIEATKVSLEENGESMEFIDYVLTMRNRKLADGESKVSLHIITDLMLSLEQCSALASDVKASVFEKNVEFLGIHEEMVEPLCGAIDETQYHRNGSLSLPYGVKYTETGEHVNWIYRSSVFNSNYFITHDDDMVQTVDMANYSLPDSAKRAINTISDGFIAEAIKHVGDIEGLDVKAFDFMNIRRCGNSWFAQRVRSSYCKSCERSHDSDNTLILLFNEPAGKAYWKCTRSDMKSKQFYHAQPKIKTLDSDKKETKRSDENESGLDSADLKRNLKLLNYIADEIDVDVDELSEMMTDDACEFSFDWREKHVNPHNRPITDSYLRWGRMIDYVHSYKFENEVMAVKLLALLIDKYYVIMVNGQCYRRPNLINTECNSAMTPEQSDPLLSMKFHIDGKIKTASKLIKDHMPYFHKYENFVVSFERLLSVGDLHEFNSCVPFKANLVEDEDYDESAFDGITSFIREVVCNSNEKLFDQLITWKAKMFQFPDDKTEMVPILYSPPEGCGKTAHADLMTALIGIHSIATASGSIESLVSERREHLIGKKLCIVNEVREMKSAYGKIHEAFKSFISDKYMDVRPLYAAKITIRNVIETIITTNNLATIPTGKQARRLQIFKLSEKYRQDKKYFAKLYNKYINNPIAINNFYTYLVKKVKVSRGPMAEIVECDAQKEFTEATESNVQTFWNTILSDSVYMKTPEVNMSKDAAYGKYRTWCMTNGETLCGHKSFGSQSMGIANVQDKRNSTERYWLLTRPETFEQEPIKSTVNDVYPSLD